MLALLDLHKAFKSFIISFKSVNWVNGILTHMLKNFTSLLFLLPLLVLARFPLLAVVVNPDQYKFSLLDMSDGLSNNQIKCFLKDSHGFLWIGTMSGLNRYDGYEIREFKYDSKDTSSIVGNTILKLFEDPEMNVWVQTNYGYSIYSHVTGKFSSNREAFLKKYNLPTIEIENIIQDHDGNFWFINAGQGVTKYDPHTLTSITLKHSPSDVHSLGSNNISSIAPNAQGDIWVAHRNGIVERLDGKTLTVKERNLTIYQKFDQELLFYDLLVDSEDDVWVFLPFDSRGLFLYKPNENSTYYFHKGSHRYKLNHDLARGLVEAKPGLIWAGMDHGGINVIDKKSLTVQYIQHHDEVAKSLAHNSINTMYKDNEGIVWVGTVKNGVNYYHENIMRFPHFKHHKFIKGSLPYDDINAFVEDERGNIWLGTNGNGLLYWDRTTGEYTQYKHDPENENTLSSDIVVSMLMDSQKNLWIGTYLGGLNKFDGQKFTVYKNDPNDKNSVADNSIWEIFEDSKGNLWLGTLSKGVDLFDLENEEFRHFPEGNSEMPIHCNYISAFAEDQHGNIWIGGGYGVDVINLEKGEATYFSHDPKDPQSLVTNDILYILNDSENRIWIGTSDGLSLYNEKDSTFFNVKQNDGLPNSTIIAILEDDNGHLWLSTSNGLSNLILNRKDESGDNIIVSFRNYDEQDGLQSRAFNANAARKLSRGELIFGGAKGFNLFHPDDLSRNDAAPEVVFTDFQLFNKSVTPGEEINGRVLLEKSVLKNESITLKHDENVFSIQFAALNFLHSNKNNYKYKLEGFDKDWLVADKNSRKVTYTNLDPGTYKFKVIAANNDDIWNEKGAEITITVLAPYWQTPLAYAIYGVFIIVVLFFVRRFMINRERLNFKIEQERRDARKMHELDLMKIRFFTNVSHEFRTPLSLILAPIEKLLKQSYGTDQYTQYQMIHRNAKRLLNLVNQLLDFRKLEVEGMRLHLSQGNVVSFIEEIVLSFSDLSEKKNIALSFHSVMPSLYASFDTDKLEKILFNLLSNAFKFTPENGKINVEVNCYDSDSSSVGLKMLKVKVRDTGIGLAKEKQERIFDRFFRSDVPDSMVNQGSGIGLSITKEFVKIHGGEIRVESELGKGSCFEVTIPIQEVECHPSEENKNTIVQQLRHGHELIASEGIVGPGKAPLVLLVEDNVDFRFYLKDNLRSHFSIIEAQNGHEGWQKALSYMPDLIVSDLMMPEMDGITLCKKIKGDPRTSHIPLVLLTADSTDEQRLKGLRIGANDYITKPFNFEILLTRIENIIDQRHALQKVLEKKISVKTSEVEIVSMDDKLIQKAIKIVEDNLSNADFTVEDLSREIGMSRVHLYKKMVALTGKSPVEFIRNIRLQRAAQFLEKSQLTVSEVAYKVGFNNRKYFSKHFKNEFNVLPSVYAAAKQS